MPNKKEPWRGLWHCPACDRWLPDEQYHRDKRTANGLKSQCKKCHTIGNLNSRSKMNRTRVRKFARKHARHMRKLHPEKHRARLMLQRAIDREDIIRPKICSQCERKNIPIHAHHKDYSKPFDVMWVCSACHGILHSKYHYPLKGCLA